jgi:molybdopterin synthase catalytic subunit
VRRDSYGAVVSFIGTVRGISGGKEVQHLEFEALPPMAERKLKEIVEEIESRWGLKDIAISHRIGRIEVGEVIIVIAIGAPHRQEAFEACQFAIDRLKEIVPIWKKEVYKDGEEWVG